MKTGLKNKVERLYNIFWILFFIMFGLDFITTNLSIHVFGLRVSNGFPGDIMPVENPLLYLAFFILILVFAYGGTEYWRQKGIEMFGRKSHEIITFIAAMVPLAFAVAMIPLVLRNLQRIFGIIS
jgi:hypothetical protein